MWCLILFPIGCRGGQQWGNAVRDSELAFGRFCPQECEAMVEIGHSVLTVGDFTQFYKNIKLKAAILFLPRHLWPSSVSSTFSCRNFIIS